MWEQRWHPLREEWVIVAAHRQSRPWSGEQLGGAGGAAAGLRRRLLPVSRQRAGQREGQPAVHRHVRLRQRSPVRGPRCPESAGPAAPAVSRRTGLGPGTRRLLQPAPRRHVGRAAGRGHRCAAGHLAGSDARAGRATRGRACARLREQGRGRRRQQPASALPDLRHQLRLQVHRDRDACGRALPGRYRACPVPGCPEGRAHRRPPDPVRARRRDRVCAVLRALRVRGVRRADPDARVAVDPVGPGARRSGRGAA